MYPILSEEKIIEYLKDHKLKTVIKNILEIIKQYHDILLKLFLEENRLIIQLVYSTTVTDSEIKEVAEKIKVLIQNYKDVVLIDNFMMYEEHFNILTGFN